MNGFLRWWHTAILRHTVTTLPATRTLNGPSGYKCSCGKTWTT